MDLGLQAKRALVTGGSRGIGKAIARQLGQEGARVAIAARDKDRLDAAAQELREGTGAEFFPFVIQTGEDDSVRSTVPLIAEALGGIDILINCAAQPGGVAMSPKWEDVSTEELLAEINVKVMGYLRVIQQVAPYMISAGWGRIVNISGLAARSTGTIVGSMRNVSVSALTKNLADQLGPLGVNVTVVHPGVTRTERTTEQRIKAAAESVSIGRIVDAEEVAAVVTFLASPRSVAINGDAIAAGGGVKGAIYY